MFLPTVSPRCRPVSAYTPPPLTACLPAGTPQHSFPDCFEQHEVDGYIKLDIGHVASEPLPPGAANRLPPKLLGCWDALLQLWRDCWYSATGLAAAPQSKHGKRLPDAYEHDWFP